MAGAANTTAPKAAAAGNIAAVVAGFKVVFVLLAIVLSAIFAFMLYQRMKRVRNDIPTASASQRSPDARSRSRDMRQVSEPGPKAAGSPSPSGSVRGKSPSSSSRRDTNLQKVSRVATEVARRAGAERPGRGERGHLSDEEGLGAAERAISRLQAGRGGQRAASKGEEATMQRQSTRVSREPSSGSTRDADSGGGGAAPALTPYQRRKQEVKRGVRPGGPGSQSERPMDSDGD